MLLLLNEQKYRGYSEMYLYDGINVEEFKEYGIDNIEGLLWYRRGNDRMINAYVPLVTEECRYVIVIIK